MGCTSSKDFDAELKDNFFGEDHANKNKNNDVSKNEIIEAMTNTNNGRSSDYIGDVQRGGRGGGNNTAATAAAAATAAKSSSVLPVTQPKKDKSTKDNRQKEGRPTTKTIPTETVEKAASATATTVTDAGKKKTKKKNTHQRIISNTTTNSSATNKQHKKATSKFEAPPSTESFVERNFIDEDVRTEKRITNVVKTETGNSSKNKKKQVAATTTTTTNMKSKSDSTSELSSSRATAPAPADPPPPPPPPPPSPPPSFLLSKFLEVESSRSTMYNNPPTSPRKLDDDDFSVAPSLAVEQRSIVAGGVPITPKTPKDVFFEEGNTNANANANANTNTNTKNTVATNVTFDDIYSRGAQLGFGAFANVFLATHKPTGETYAVKEVDRTKMMWNKKNHLQHEIDNMFKVREGPNIVQLYEVYYNNNDDDGDDIDSNNNNNKKNLCHMIIELMPGGELFERIIDKGKFTEREARDSIRCVLEALNYMHDKRVAHRDLKPENLLLQSRDRSKLTPVKIADFGFAKSIEKKNSCRSLCGTPGYLAPEILERFPSYDVPCDIWSVGVILFLLLGGYLPFDDSDEKKVFDHTRNARYCFPPQYWTYVSSGAKDLISNCLTLDTRKRYTAKDCLKCDWMVNNEAARDAELTGVVDKLQVARNKGKQKIRAAVQTVSLMFVCSFWIEFCNHRFCCVSFVLFFVSSVS
jgi:calcium/calmodulin-dependent protein kinase I